MNNREIRDALASVFLEVELTVRVKHARSTNSVYVTVSNGHGSLAYVIRIANHPSSRKHSKIDDYWIDASKRNVVPDINAAIQGAASRLGVRIAEVVPEEPQPVEEKLKTEVSEEAVQTSDYSTKFYQDDRQSMINLEQYYLSPQGFVCEIDNNPEKKAPVMPLSKDGDSEQGDMLKFWLCLALILLSVWLFTK
jgi:hypothetical protein